MLKQFLITPAAGKRLIARALATYDPIKKPLKKGTVVIIAGTTNGYVAEEILSKIGQNESFSRKRFFRGINIPPTMSTTESGRLPDESGFPGDVIIEDGVWQKGKTIFDVVDNLKEGDVVLKGANAVNIRDSQAAIYIGHPNGGTIGASLQAVIGRRTRLIIPVGLEKRVLENLNDLALKLNTPGAEGPRLLPVPGEVFTEIEAIELLANVRAELVAGGGVCGAEGCIWLAITGKDHEINEAEKILNSVSHESSFEL